jgi:hypothetical protein
VLTEVVPHNQHSVNEARANRANNSYRQAAGRAAVEEGDLVAVHSRVQHRPDDRGAALVHLFRFEATASSRGGTSGRGSQPKQSTRTGCSEVARQDRNGDEALDR